MDRQPHDVPFLSCAQEFLRQLDANNSKAWFSSNRELYECSLKDPGNRFCESVCACLAERLSAPCDFKVFRIHRDLRFSKDKTPYNTHFRASFGPITEESFNALWHLNIEPKKASFGVGKVSFSKLELASYRQAVISDHGTKLSDILSVLNAKGYRVSDLELKRAPKGFPALPGDESLLLRKSISVWGDIDDQSLDDPSLAGAFAEFVSTSMALSTWLQEQLW